jgi:hypothetical protein
MQRCCRIPRAYRCRPGNLGWRVNSIARDLSVPHTSWVSFSADVRAARDRSRTLPEREAALARCVTRFRPFGLLGTFAYLDRRAGAGGDPSDRLVAAVEILELAHAAWRDELARFAQQRKTAKAAGLRRVTPAEIARYRTFGWPGDSTGESNGQPLDLEFLRGCGLALWTPEPVNLRRRLRWAQRALQPGPRFDGCLSGCMIVVEAVLALLAWVIFDPPSIFWYGFGGTAAVTLVGSVFAGFRQAAREHARHRSAAEALNRRRDALVDRLRRAEHA